MMLSTVFALSCLFVAFMITALEPRLTARSIRLARSLDGDLPESPRVIDPVKVVRAA